MAKKTTTAESIQVPGGARLNNQTAGNLIKYLRTFPSGAKVQLWNEYKTYDCQICINFDNQKQTNTVMLMQGNFLQDA